MATHSSPLAWKIPWMEEPGRLQSMGSLKSQTQLSDFTSTFHFHALKKEMATHSSVLGWRIPRTAEPGGLPSMESHRVRHDWSDLAVAAAACGGEVVTWKAWGPMEIDVSFCSIGALEQQPLALCSLRHSSSTCLYILWATPKILLLLKLARAHFS